MHERVAIDGNPDDALRVLLGSQPEKPVTIREPRPSFAKQVMSDPASVARMQEASDRMRSGKHDPSDAISYEDLIAPLRDQR